ncbi:MAG: transglycosylase SLT domain-containing protein [Treponema sp.]|nr:transglycosylase SLT domain-containing protein [Treponema sp.]
MKKLELSILIFFTLFNLFSQETKVSEESFADESIPIEEAIIKEAEFYQAEEEKKELKSENLDNSNGESSQEIQEKVQYIELPYPGMDRPEVEKFRKQYLSPKWSALLHTYLERAMEYRLYVRKAIQDQELPQILEYLPVVESNYITTAKSSSGALGMWQFMANSVYPFLELNDFVDQRLDPWKSTDAALKKLKDNYNTFNDWLIAIAAYNCGAGAMRRALNRSQSDDFWELVDKKAISGQTSNYVPKLLAIADLAINAEYYGIDLPNHNEEFENLINEKEGNFDYISVDKAYSINQLAAELRMDPKTLNRLNPSYLLGMTHPNKKSEIRLPLGMKESALQALENLSPIDFPVKYTVQSGDSLWSISRKYGVSINSICEINNIKENAILRIGKILYIPSKSTDY